MGLRPKIYVAGASTLSIQGGLNLTCIKQIPTVLDIFSRNAQFVWAYFGHASSKEALLKGDDPRGIINTMNLNCCATITAYKLPDSVSLPPILREFNGVRLYQPTPIRQYPD